MPPPAATNAEAVRCVTIADAAELTTLSRRMIARMIREGSLAAAKIGRRRVIPLEALRAVVAQAGRGA